jgi:hypothetical protein
MFIELTKDDEIINRKKFKDWVLSVRPKDVRDKGISKMALWKIKNKIKQEKTLNPKTKIVKILLQLYKEIKLNKNN